MKLTQVDIRQRLRASGVKVTPQRVAIYQALTERVDHPTVDDLHRQVLSLYPMMSPNTVYYTLGVLQEAGLVKEVNYWHDRSRFDANTNPHHHLLCLACRKIQDLSEPALDSLTLSQHARAGFQITGHQVEFHGYCAACRTKFPGRKAPRGRVSSLLKRRIR